MNTTTTKRTLALSVASILVCVAALVGATYAWFTDNATASVSKIEAGTLDIDIVGADGASLDGKTLGFKKAAEGDQNILWEPGQTWELDQAWLVNTGSLDAKYQVVISGIDGSSKLAEVIEVWTGNAASGPTLAEVVANQGVVDEGTIAANTTKEGDVTFGTVKLHMKESAGNEYQGLTLNGITVTVNATQAASEYDSYNNTYDESAEFDNVVVIPPAATAGELKENIANVVGSIPAGESAVVTLPATEAGEDIVLPNVSDKDVTFTGTKDTVIDVSDNIGSTGADITFEGVTVTFDNDAYEGFQHSDKVVYKDCTIKGTQFLYSDTDFINCTFEAYDDTTEYNVWTYGATNVTFTNCTFSSTGKAVLVYTEGEQHADITLNNCTFTSSGKYTGKAAVEVGSSPNSADTTYNIYLNNCTATDFAANNSTSDLWGNKNSMDKEHLNVVIDGVDVY